jgi:anti-anti-sigma factor
MGSTMQSQITFDNGHLRISGEMTVRYCAQLLPDIMTALGRDDSTVMQVDLSGVTEIDTAGLQALLIARRELGTQRRELRIVEASPAMRRVLELCHLDHLIGGATAGSAVS